MEDFWVSLDALKDTAGLLRRQQHVVQEQVDVIKGHFKDVEAAWSSPAGATFPPLAAQFSPAMQTLCELLLESAQRMDAAYQVYYDAEQANHDNLRGQRGPLH